MTPQPHSKHRIHRPGGQVIGEVTFWRSLSAAVVRDVICCMMNERYTAFWMRDCMGRFDQCHIKMIMIMIVIIQLT